MVRTSGNEKAKRAALHCEQLDPQLLIWAYRNGMFPMADDHGLIQWYSPDPRAIIDLNKFRPPRNIRSLINKRKFTISVNRAFDQVIRKCAARDPTWISNQIIQAYQQLYQSGYAHSVECWLGTELAGGLYGVAIGAAFFGESMFHNYTDASKVALAALVSRIRQRGMELLDVQYMTKHLWRSMAYQVPHAHYMELLKHALSVDCQFAAGPEWIDL